jgi:hypothetical protein
MKHPSTSATQVSDLAHLVRWFLLGVVVMLVAWRVVTLGLADHRVSQGAYYPALELRPHHFVALERAALDVAETQPERAFQMLERALVENPVRGMTYARLGALSELHGDGARARVAVDAAIRHAPESVDVRLVSSVVELARNDLLAALLHWNVALQRRSSLRQELYPTLLSLAEQPGNLPAFVELLDRGALGPWWPWFVAYAAERAGQLETVASLYAVSRDSEHNPVRERPLGQVLLRLQREGLWLDARLAWLESLPEEQLAGMGNVFNGGFEVPITDMGFDWIRQRAGHIVVERMPTQAVEGDHALLVQFRGPRVQFRHLSQLVMLPPGSYVLRGQARPDGLETAHGLLWTVACANAPGRRLGATSHFKGRGGWQAFEADFVVPAENCPVQVLRLELGGRVALDFDARGAVWFDAMSIAPRRH